MCISYTYKCVDLKVQLRKILKLFKKTHTHIIPAKTTAIGCP